MSVDTQHPQYIDHDALWTQIYDTYRGEHVVKARGTMYLPATEGMQADGLGSGQPGLAAYTAYLNRAVFHDFVKQGVEAMLGIMHREPARIEVPARMEPLLEQLSVVGEDAQSVLRKLNEYQLIYGRAGLLVESPDGGGPNDLPFLAIYAAPSIINWDDGVRRQGRQRLELVVLDESDHERVSGFRWQFRSRFRVLAMSDIASTLGDTDQEDVEAGGVYQVNALPPDATDVQEGVWITPTFSGRALDRIPFVFVNTKDLVSDVDDPPLLGLSNLSLAVYRGEADYRQNLYLQGQDTLVIIGAESDDSDGGTRIGAGAKIQLPRDGDAKFIGVSSAGLSEQRDAIANDKASSGELTTRLFDTAGTTYQSGAALRIRVSAKTATLRSIAETGAAALQEALEIIAEWIGEDPNQVKVEPNTEFAETTTASRTALELVQAKQMGFPLSARALHRYAMRHDLTDMSYEDELAEMKEEDILEFAPHLVGGAAGGAVGATGAPSEPPGGGDDNNDDNDDNDGGEDDEDDEG